MEKWRQVKEIFDQAIKLAPAERQVFLDKAAAVETDVRREVEELLSSFNNAASFPGTSAVSNERSELLKGKAVGRYKIERQIGAGGMGEVFLAEDLRLHRKIALKILPADVAEDQDRLRRFEQEAFSASALNHPNILTIYEFGEEKGVHFLAAELVEGETLREKLNAERLAIDEALEIAAQIVAALCAAHEAGIVHRDIKPENVMIRRDRLVKVLDFGLAKLSERKTEPLDTEAETRAQVKTAPGVVMGTVAYMSPEQARGRETDARSDIWSLGCVLYEMIARCRAFEGETTADLIAAIIHKQPAPLSRFAENVPPRLEEIVLKCLEKDADERYQTAKDLLVDLRRLKKRLEFDAEVERSAPAEDKPAADKQSAANQTQTQILPAAQTGAAQTRTTSNAEVLVSEIKRHKTSAAIALLVLLLALGGIGYAVYRFAAPAPTPPKARFQNVKLTRVTSEGSVASVTVSPDGKYIAYALEESGKRSLWTKHLGSNSRVQIVAPVEASQMEPSAFTPDGGYVLYDVVDEQNPQGALFQIPVLGGTPRKILTDIGAQALFSPDGKQISFGRNRTETADYQYFVANADGTNERLLISLHDPEWFTLYGASWSPDGKTLATAYGNEDGGEHMTVAGISVADGTLKPLSDKRWFRVWRVEWLGDGSGLVCIAREQPTSESQVWRVAYPSGEAQRVTNDLNSYQQGSLTATADASALVALQANNTSSIWLAPTGDANRARSISARKNANEGASNLAWNSDGKLIYSADGNNKTEFWMTDAGGSPKMLTEDATAQFLQVSPDNRYLVFASYRSGIAQVWRADANGENARQLTDDPKGVLRLAVTPDGRSIVYSLYGGEVWKIPIDGGSAVKLADGNLDKPQFSPDGKTLALMGYDEQKRQQIKLFAFNENNLGAPFKTYDLPVTSEDEFRWSPDGRALVFVNTEGGISNLWRQPLDGGKPAPITNFDSGQIWNFAYSREGRQLALARGETTRDVVLINNAK